MTHEQAMDMRLNDNFVRIFKLEPSLFQTERRDYRQMAIRHRLPVVITGWEFFRWDVDIWRLEIRFRHPCPCEGWKLDREFIFRREMGSLYYRNVGWRRVWRECKMDIRHEACNHVMEFLRTGQQDGQ